jgi:hypothetical protein
LTSTWDWDLHLGSVLGIQMTSAKMQMQGWITLNSRYVPEWRFAWRVYLKGSLLQLKLLIKHRLMKIIWSNRFFFSL